MEAGPRARHELREASSRCFQPGPADQKSTLCLSECLTRRGLSAHRDHPLERRLQCGLPLEGPLG
jgi:hypothetical protein